MRFRENIALSEFSHYKIGGRARFFFEPKNEKEITWAVGEAKAQKLPIFVLGGGTNLLLSDDGFDGLVIKPNLTILRSQGTRIEAGAGVPMAKLLTYAMGKSLSGLEWAGGLPGTLGGAIRGNAGCFGGEIKDVVASVRSFDIKKMRFVTRNAKACAFGYRDSIFKKDGVDEIIVSATLAVTKGVKADIAAAMKSRITHRATHHPLEYPNIGSIFKNVPLARIHATASKKYRTAMKEGTIAFRGSQFSVKTDPFPVVSAAKMIGETGLRGVSFGGALISAKHPNFIVNALDAKAADVKTLIGLTKASVKKKFGVVLEEEVQII